MKKNLLPSLPGTGRLREMVPFIGGGVDTGVEKLPKVTVARRGDGGRGDKLALTEVRGNLTFTANTVTCWFVLAEQVWPFKADARREALMQAIARQYANLAGLRLHVRRTSVPFPVESWLRNLEVNSRPLPDTALALTAAETIYDPQTGGPAPYSPTWEQHLLSAATSLVDGRFAAGRTYLGITLPRNGAGVLRMGKATPATDDLLIGRFAEIGETIGGYGMAARNATSAELLWLIYRSVGMGLTPPSHTAGDVGPDDIAEFADAVAFERTRYGKTTKITDRRSGHSTYAAVLTLGRMEPLNVPQVHQPWLHLSEQLGYPVEVSSRVDILTPAGSRGSLEHRLRMIRSQQHDYEDHGLDEPLSLERVATLANQISDQLDTGLPIDSVRAHGWHRLAVQGDTEEECLARVRDIARVYEQEVHATLTHPLAQWHLLREFIPGEPLADTGYIRRMPVTMLAAAMPQATASVGDNRGDLIGHTATSGVRPVFWDPHFATEVRERSGLAVIVAEPGGGKSTLMGALGYLNARRGVQVTLMDPSGPLAQLCQMPELAPYSRVVNLAGSQPGTLAPYALIPTPVREAYDYDELGGAEFEQATAMAEAERNLLVLDISRMLLPPQMGDQAEIALRKALRLVPPRETSTLDDVIEALRVVGTNTQDTFSHNIADLLEDNRSMPLARLFFGTPPPGTLTTDAALTVITMQGLRLPDIKIPRSDWSVEERLALPMLHLANRLAVRRAYSGDQHARKMVGLDEAHFMSAWASGRSFLIRLARDSRKWNLAALVASQNPRDILDLDVQNLVSTVFVGRIADNPGIAAGALEMLGVPPGTGYEATLAGLSQHADTASNERLGFRELVMRDVDSRVQKIRADFGYVPGLLDALDTTPGGAR